ncbi:MaoC family dehydratase [Alteromonas oceanisediminis]|uniref:MaoC family dehydratase n=1 Tax=Alteromonas oceanisediminis TaxID=2836180 RepID=UPI001BD96A9B|nr:MaoC family dehydratase [Alteromonas oceanisediminis]MBT0586642.1 MaoC family dehydratase [Alteromonas oceanisediminis]
MALTLLDLSPEQSLPATAWVTVTQQHINTFADATGDHQWIHVDVEKCAKESPFKQPIAHGFLSASLMPGAFEQAIAPHPDISSVLNYGINNLRFLEPVRVNDRVRYQFKVAKIEQKPLGRLYSFDCIVEIDGRDKPALVGQFLMLAVIRSAP